MVVDRTLERSPSITVRFETGDSFRVPAEFSIREIAHHLDTPDVPKELRDILNRIQEAHETQTIEGKEPDIEIRVNGRTTSLDSQLTEFEEEAVTIKVD